VCGLTLPATRPAAPYEDLVRIIEHGHPKARLGRCIGSRMLAKPMEGDIQIHLFGEAGEAA